MPTAFDDIPLAPAATEGAFDDIPTAETSAGAFDDLPDSSMAISAKLQDPAYTPSRQEFEVWKDSEDAKGWFQPGEWIDSFTSGLGGIKDMAVNAGKALYGKDSIAENPMDAAQTALEAGARGTLNDLELFGRKIPATVGRAITAVGETGIAALTGVQPDSGFANFYSRKMAELNRAANPTGSPTFEWFTPATVPKELELQWRAEYQTQAKPATDYGAFLSKRADQLEAVKRSQGEANLVPPILGKADNAIAEFGSLFANPSTVATLGVGAAPRAGATILERAAAGAATGVGKAATATGRAAQLVAKFPSAVIARGVELAGGTAETAAAAAKLVEGGSLGATLASPAIAVPGLTQAAIAMQATKRGGQLIEAAGEASGAVGRSIAQGPSRTGLLGTIATDGKAPEWIRKAAAAAKVIDPAIEFTGRTLESGVHGAAVGAVFGGLAEGNMEGVAQGAGAGFGLGVGFGTVGRVIGFRGNLEAKRQADLNRWFGNKSPEEQAQLHALGMDRTQALRLATTEEFVRGMRGANGESDVRFQYVDNATFERAFGTSAKGAEHIAADQPVIVINVERANGRTPLHEAMHGLLDLGLTPEVKAELQRKLFTQQAPDGTVLTEGVFSFDDQQRSLQQYTARLSPQTRAEFNLLPAAEQLAKIRTELAAEAFANLVEGKNPDYLLRGLTGVRRRMADTLVQAQQGTILRLMRQGLEALGVKFDSSGAPSELFVKNGRPVTNSPEVDAALRDYLRAKTKVLNRLAAADDSPAGLVVTRQDMMSKNAKAVAELFKDNDNFKKDAAGNVAIERGLPVLNTPREIAKVQSKRVDEILSALERSPTAIGGTGRQPMRLKPNGAWEGHYFTPEQLAEINRIPDSVIAPSLKEKIRQLNDLHAPGDGRRYVIDYNAATKEARGGGRVYSSSISSTLRDVVPLTFHVSKAGNFYTTTLDTTALHAKLNRWMKDHRSVFDAWGGNRDAVIADVFKYLDNHASDRPGSYGLDSGAATAVHKKNVINDLFGVARGSGANPLDLSTKAGKDNLIKSFRLDRTNRITESGGEKMPFDYYKAKANLLPEDQTADNLRRMSLENEAGKPAAGSESQPGQGATRWSRIVEREFGEQYERTVTTLNGQRVDFSTNGEYLRFNSPSNPRGKTWWANYDSSGRLLQQSGNTDSFTPPPPGIDRLAQDISRHLTPPHGSSPAFIRFGAIPKSGRSKNHVTGQMEKGVSVYTAKWNPALRVYELADADHAGTAMDLIAQGFEPNLLTGEVVGKGSDGEPVIASPKKVGKLLQNEIGFNLDDHRPASSRGTPNFLPAGKAKANLLPGDKAGRSEIDAKERADQKFLISPSKPWISPVADHMTTRMEPSREALTLRPGSVGEIGNIIRHYPNLRGMKGTGAEVLDAFHNHVVDNLVWLYNVMPPDMRDAARHWYLGANKLGREYALKYNLPRQASAGVIAALSPSKDWFRNVALGERMMDMHANGRQRKVDAPMVEWMRTQPAALRPVMEKLYRDRVPYEKMNVIEKALFQRSYDEVHRPQEYRIVLPDGTFGDWKLNADGKRSKLVWQSYDNISKAIEIMENPTRETLDANLGYGHKVRSFFVNQLVPSDPIAVCIDTHAAAVALLRPLGGDHLEVKHNFGGTLPGYRGIPGNSSTGATGTYGLLADGYREAARRLGILPRELQSAVWEAGNRWLFPEGFKVSENANLIEQAWQVYKKGDIDLKQVRHELLKYTVGEGDAAFARAARLESLSLGGVPGQGRGPADAGGVSQPDPRRQRAGALPARAGGGAARAVAGVKKANFLPAGKDAPKVFESAKRTMGATQRIDEAGYILPDGTLLDFTGRHYGTGYERKGDYQFGPKAGQPDYVKGQRQVDHREIEFDGVPDNGGDAMLAFQDLGAIRTGQGLIDMRVKPTSAQESQIRRVVEHNNGEVVVDLVDGQRQSGLMFPEGTSGAKVLGKIRRFFNGENIESGINFLPAGKEWNATTPSAGVPVKGKYELREAKDLVTSFDKGFDAALQPRDRTRMASVNQIASIVQKFEPQRLGEAPTTDLGAPVIDDAGQVLSGNGRVTSLRTIYGAQDPSRGEGYKQFLMQNAEQFGFKAADIAGMTEPVLVRRVDDYGGLAKAEFARQSNQSQLLAMSGAEKAAADARLLTEHPDILDKFAPSEEGNVMATSNHEFLNHFIAATGDQAELLSGKGYNNDLVRKRVETAILATVIGPENRKLITSMIERADKFKMRKAVNGLMMSAPSLVKLKGTAYDLSAYLSQAMGDLVRMRGASENVETFLASKPLVGDDGRTAASDHILEFLSKAKSQKQVAEDLRRYLFMAKNAIADAQSGGLFGETPRSREQLLGEIYGRVIRPIEPAAVPVAVPVAPAASASAFDDLIPAEAAQPAPSPAPVAAQPVPAAPAVSPAPIAAPRVAPPAVPPPLPRNATVADWSFRNGSPQIRAGAGSYLPTGSALRASANEIVQHTREEAAYAFSERLEGLPRNTGLLLAREFLTKAEARQPANLLATERTRRAAAALAAVPAEGLAPVIQSNGLNAARQRMETYLPTTPPRPR